MSERSTVVINGVAYDAHTGLRVDDAAPAAKVEAKPTHDSPASRTLHRKTERTHTLSRAHVAVPPKHQAAANKRAAVHTAKSPMISRFGQDIVPASHAIRHAVKETADIQPTHRVHSVKHHAGAEIKPHHQGHSAQEIKERAISKALENSAPASAKDTSAEHHTSKRRLKFVSITSVATALILLAGYLTYLNLPSISVRVAAAQAGIAATYPSYQPSGYSLHGPVAYSDGKVAMEFGANAGPQQFTIDQEKSSWDSSALLDNYVQSRSGGNYTTYTDSGLTIYVYGTDAAWVNDGILHTINGDAPLTSEQIRHIATSM